MRNPDLVVAQPVPTSEDGPVLVDGVWKRKLTLEEYNALLERAYALDRDPNRGPFVVATEVPETAPMQPCAPPVFDGNPTPVQGPVARGPTRSTIRPPGVERSTPLEIVDALNELVYREAFMDTVIDHRNLRTELEELQPSSLDWEGVETLWAKIREIESSLGALPLPKNIHSRASELGTPDSSQGKVLKRWYRHSGTFRTTVNPVESK